MYGRWKPTASSGHLIKKPLFPLGCFYFFNLSQHSCNILLVSSVEKLLRDKGLLLSERGNEDIVSKNKAYTMRKGRRGGVDAAASLGVGLFETVFLILPTCAP